MGEVISPKASFKIILYVTHILNFKKCQSNNKNLDNLRNGMYVPNIEFKNNNNKINKTERLPYVLNDSKVYIFYSNMKIMETDKLVITYLNNKLDGSALFMLY